MTDEKITAELVTALSEVCQLDDETVDQLRPILLKVIQKNLAEFASAPAPKAKKGAPKKEAKEEKDAKEEKEEVEEEAKTDKIHHRNAYHFFVNAKMDVVKDNKEVAAKQRMKAIGDMWKLLNEDDKKSFQDQARRYNESVDAAIQKPDWVAHRDEIIETASMIAGVPKKVKPVPEAKPAPAPVPAPVPAPAPVVVPAPAPVPEPVVAPGAPAPVRRAKKIAK
jgi:ribosomal protein L12E/L44/L45/RPP1/RPP2